MLEPRNIEIETKNVTGIISKILPIEKGFSAEKKWRVIAEKGTFLLRSSSANILARKREEYDLMGSLYNQGVKCNKPVCLFESTDKTTIYSLFHYLPGQDAETCINNNNRTQQYEIGVKAGKDLKKINGIKSDSKNWHERKWEKHNRYVNMYKEMGYSFPGDQKVQQFVETNYNVTESNPDVLLHDDFHLGNIIVNNNDYGGILDFNRYDWGDPLHEFVKLEWFTWPISKDFARGQVQGYFGEYKISEADCRKISIYIAMSLFSTVVWTLKFHPNTMGSIENKIQSILQHYSFFEKTVPDWAK